jgi:hypothetical protein
MVMRRNSLYVFARLRSVGSMESPGLVAPVAADEPGLGGEVEGDVAEAVPAPQFVQPTIDLNDDVPSFLGGGAVASPVWSRFDESTSSRIFSAHIWPQIRSLGPSADV